MPYHEEHILWELWAVQLESFPEGSDVMQLLNDKRAATSLCSWASIDIDSLSSTMECGFLRRRCRQRGSDTEKH